MIVMREEKIPLLWGLLTKKMMPPCHLRQLGDCKGLRGSDSAPVDLWLSTPLRELNFPRFLKVVGSGRVVRELSSLELYDFVQTIVKPGVYS